MATSKPPNRSPCPDRPGVVWGVCLLLAIAVFLVFGQTLRHGFINFDDDVYVYGNPHVTRGLTFQGMVWAFTHSVSNLYHPLTMMSLMLDGQFYGLNPGGYHLTNVLLHAAAAVLLFLALRRMMSLRPEKSGGATASPAGVLWPSAFVAAVFAIHPLRVESVAWVTERKDVLSGLFFMLTLLLYARYAQKRSQVESRESRGGATIQTLDSRSWTLDYVLALLFYALGLLSKPTLVTLPFLLLLLDYWPLGRFTTCDLRFAIQRLLLEKLPLFALAAVFSLLTFITQKNAGALAVLARQPLTLRWENALVNYGTYILKMLWPENLAVLYPYRATEPAWKIIVAGVLLLFVTVLAVRFARRLPYLMTGWWWYLGMLVPMIGIVQAGFVTRADRFTYLPQIGLYLIAAWGMRDLTASWRYRRQVLGAGALGVMVVLMVCAWKQTSYWHDSESLWTHTLACTSDNALAHIDLSLAFAAKGRWAKAIEHCQKAIELSPNQPQAYNNLGNVFAAQGQNDEAIQYFQKAIRIRPGYAEAHNNLANVLAKEGRFAEAIAQYQKAIQLDPDYAEARYNLGAVFGLRGRLEEAVEQYRQAIRIKPDYADAHGNLANVLLAQGHHDEAIREYRRTLELVPDSAQARCRFGQALQTLHRFAAAKTEYQKALELEPKHLLAHLSLAWLLATCPEASLRDGNQAVELAQQAVQLSAEESPQVLDTLGAAYAEAGRFAEAVTAARRALNLPATQSNQPLAEAIQSRLRLYETNFPYRETN